MAKATNPPANIELYADSEKIEPRKVRGPFRTLKWWGLALTMAFWHLAPFMRWDRGPDAPSQAILADMAGRRAYFFGIEIWPQEVYYLTGILLLAALLLFLMSALAGRIWCGFLCWQTVYTDLFVAVERWVIGDRNVRIALDRKPWTGEKILKRGLVNLIWAVIAAACGVSFVLYFDDAFSLLGQIVDGTAGSAVYATIAIVGGCCYLLAGFAREQVCIYMCPYARFQSAMFDEHSLIISYESWRGEPRGKARLKQSFEGRGHCVDCRVCVQTCPTGVDIREGTQLACIGCGLCIDACNGVMDRFGLPHGLISYDSAANIMAREKGESTKIRLVRPRTIVYAAACAVVGGVMLAALATRTDTEVNILHERSPLFAKLRDGSIRNGYTYKVLNMVRRDRHFTVAIEGIPNVALEVVGEEGAATTDLEVTPDTVGTFRLYVTVPEADIHGRTTPLYFLLTDKETGKVFRTKTVFMGPDKQ